MDYDRIRHGYILSTGKFFSTDEYVVHFAHENPFDLNSPILPLAVSSGYGRFPLVITAEEAAEIAETVMDWWNEWGVAAWGTVAAAWNAEIAETECNDSDDSDDDPDDHPAVVGL